MSARSGWIPVEATTLCTLGAAIAALALAGHHYYTQIGITALLFVMFAVSLNLITGTAGLLSLGHMAFAGLGAYTSSLMAIHLELPLWLCVPATGILVAMAGILLMLPSLKLVNIYFAVSTLAVAEIVLTVLVNWIDVTRGPMGLRSIPRLSLCGMEGPTINLLVVGAATMGAVAIAFRLTSSHFGNALRAVREDELSAQAMGINTREIKLKAFALACFIAGSAGALLAHTTGFISPDSFRFHESVLVLAMIVLGGLGSVPGAVIGAVALIILPEFLREIGNMRMLLVGLALFCGIVFLPQGLLGEMTLMRLLRTRPDGKPGRGFGREASHESQ